MGSIPVTSDFIILSLQNIYYILYLINFTKFQKLIYFFWLRTNTKDLLYFFKLKLSPNSSLHIKDTFKIIKFNLFNFSLFTQNLGNNKTFLQTVQISKLNQINLTMNLNFTKINFLKKKNYLLKNITFIKKSKYTTYNSNNLIKMLTTKQIFYGKNYIVDYNLRYKFIKELKNYYWKCFYKQPINNLQIRHNSFNFIKWAQLKKNSIKYYQLDFEKQFRRFKHFKILMKRIDRNLNSSTLKFIKYIKYGKFIKYIKHNRYFMIRLKNAVPYFSKIFKQNQNYKSFAIRYKLRNGIKKKNFIHKFNLVFFKINKYLWTLSNKQIKRLPKWKKKKTRIELKEQNLHFKDLKKSYIRLISIEQLCFYIKSALIRQKLNKKIKTILKAVYSRQGLRCIIDTFNALEKILKPHLIKKFSIRRTTNNFKKNYKTKLPKILINNFKKSKQPVIFKKNIYNKYRSHSILTRQIPIQPYFTFSILKYKTYFNSKYLYFNKINENELLTLRVDKFSKNVNCLVKKHKSRFFQHNYKLVNTGMMNYKKIRPFSLFFNITSYKLFFNLLLIYPFLLINYTNKLTTFMKYFYNKTTFKLINPTPAGDDKLIFYSSMYVEIGSFIEFFTSKQINLLIYKNNFSDINSLFKIILNIWIFRIKHFFRIFKYKFDISLFIKLMYLAIKNKDIHLIMKLITSITPRIEFKKQRKFFKFVIFLFRTHFALLYNIYNIQGFQFEFRGKISVDGNARTRKMYAKILRPSPSNYSYSAKYIYKTVNTYTGVLGLKLWIYYSL